MHWFGMKNKSQPHLRKDFENSLCEYLHTTFVIPSNTFTRIYCITINKPPFVINNAGLIYLFRQSLEWLTMEKTKL